MYGICNLSIVPVRTEPSDKSELCTQLMFGDGYTVIAESENNKWLKVRNIFDEYEGWIDKLQYNEVKESFFEAFLMGQHTMCYDDVAVVDSNHSTFLITIGSTLPFMHGRNFKIGEINYTFHGDVLETPGIVDEEFVKFVALRFMHSPYLWGGKTLFGLDCSGYTQQVFKLLGYKIKRDAYQQAEHGVTLHRINEIKTGDLAFFENDNGKIVHVGIVLEENKIIHACGQVRIDVVDEKGIFNLTTKKYSHKLNRIQRVLSFDD